MRPWIPLGLLVLAGCQDAPPSADDGFEGQPARSSAARFSDPAQVNLAGHGFEPGIKVDKTGRIVVTAHKSDITHEGSRLASWLWTSTDDGRTWQDVPSPGQSHTALFGAEGDIAFDAVGRLYFVDTYVGDNTLSRWSSAGRELRWDFSRPVQGTFGTDDRPWLAAHGDGILYYIGNNGREIPASGDAPSVDGSRFWLAKSIDGGLTWLGAHGFVGGEWCRIAAAPADDETVYVACNRPASGREDIVLFESHDQAITWTESVIGSARTPPGMFPLGLAVDQEGTPFLSYISDALTDDVAGEIILARRDLSGEWESRTITPFTGSFGSLWLAAGKDGHVGVAFYGSTDFPATTRSAWYPFALVGTFGAIEVQPDLVELDETASKVAATPPNDFFQCAMGPDDRLHVVYQRNVGQDELMGFALHDVFYAAELPGNLTPDS